MTPPRAQSHGRPARWAALAALGGAALIGWIVLGGDDAAPARPPQPAPSSDRALLASTSPARSPAQQRRAAAEPAHPGEAAAARVDEAEDETERVQAHPITEERLALLPPWETVELVKAALEGREFELARSLLAERKTTDARRDEFADFYVGLEIMTDCLESPGAASRARAELFLAEHRASPLRRHVRRKCLSPRQPR